MEIKVNQTEIIECAKSFRKDANFLMSELAKAYHFDLNDDPPKEVYRHKQNNKGTLNINWTYYFHGSECRFDNLVSGQVVELIYVTKPEFGFLDGYFLYNYISTTKRYKALAASIGEHLNLWDAIERLANEGHLKKVPDTPTHRNIIAF